MLRYTQALCVEGGGVRNVVKDLDPDAVSINSELIIFLERQLNVQQ